MLHTFLVSEAINPGNYVKIRPQILELSYYVRIKWTNEPNHLAGSINHKVVALFSLPGTFLVLVSVLV